MKQIAENYYVDENLDIISTWYGKRRVLKPAINSRGYYRVSLRIDGKMYTKKVHRLIAEAFIPNPDNKPFINHINGNKTDNRTENLEWCTQKENVQHSYDTGLQVASKKQKNKGESHGMVKLKESDIIAIRLDTRTQEVIAKECGVSQKLISLIKLCKIWKHI